MSDRSTCTGIQRFCAAIAVLAVCAGVIAPVLGTLHYSTHHVASSVGTQHTCPHDQLHDHGPLPLDDEHNEPDPQDTCPTCDLLACAGRNTPVLDQASAILTSATFCSILTLTDARPADKAAALRLFPRGPPITG